MSERRGRENRKEKKKSNPLLFAEYERPPRNQVYPWRHTTNSKEEDEKHRKEKHLSEGSVETENVSDLDKSESVWSRGDARSDDRLGVAGFDVAGPQVPLGHRRARRAPAGDTEPAKTKTKANRKGKARNKHT